MGDFFHGCVAQLGEHLAFSSVCIGSSPITSLRSVYRLENAMHRICGRKTTSILVDTGTGTGTGTVLKIGPKDKIEPYYRTMLQRYNQIGFPELYKDIKLITFNVKYNEFGFNPEGYNFSIDEVCTIINWFWNSIGDKMNEFLSMSDLGAVKAKIEHLQFLGF